MLRGAPPPHRDVDHNETHQTVAASHLAHVWPHEWVLLPAGSDEGPYVVRHGLGPGGAVPLGNLGRIAAGRETQAGTAPQAQHQYLHDVQPPWLACRNTIYCLT
jgi:hypothetical protein